MAAAVACIAIGWIALKLLPSDEKAIRKTMMRLVEAASFQPEDSGFARLGYGDRLASFFTTNAVIQLEGLGGDVPSIESRTELIQAATAARMRLRQAEFHLADLNLTFPEEKGIARAYVVVTGTINFETNQFGQAFRMRLVKSEGRWRVQEVNTVERQ